MRFCFSLLLLLAACTEPEPFVPVQQPVPNFDWRVYNGPSYSGPVVVEVQTQPSWKRATYENRARRVVIE